MADANYQQTPFVKQLAANDRPTRDKAVAALRTWLGSKRVFKTLDFMKLWKGLFYCMWMSDRPRTQQRLASDLADLLTPMNEKNFLLFLEAFWATISTQWNNIDVLRMDKFLLLVRRYLASTFRYLVSKHENEELVKDTMKIFGKVPLSATDMKVPNGLRFHLIDIYVDELEKFAPEGEKKFPLPIETLVAPFEKLMAKSPTKLVRTRSKGLLMDERLKGWGYTKAPAGVSKKDVEQEDMDLDEDEAEWGGFDD
ncbi:hypothetical protein RUND412_007295 [Rhizina undulata]